SRSFERTRLRRSYVLRNQARLKPRAPLSGHDSAGARAFRRAADLCAIKLSMAARPELIDARAADNLRFIREAMTRASAFTALPGWGGVAMGATAIAAAAVSGPPDNSLRWVMVWFGEAGVAVAVAPPART